MPEHLHYEDDDLFNPETQHESSDVNVRALLWFVVVFVIFAFATHLLLWFLYKGFVRMERKGSTTLTAVQKPADMNVPKTEPLLEPFPQSDANGRINPPTANTPVTHLSDVRRTEEEALTSYGWVDRQKGVVRVPIEVAKQIALQRGFPVRAAAAPPLQHPTDNVAAGLGRPEGALKPPPASPSAPQTGARP